MNHIAAFVLRLGYAAGMAYAFTKEDQGEMDAILDTSADLYGADAYEVQP